MHNDGAAKKKKKCNILFEDKNIQYAKATDIFIIYLSLAMLRKVRIVFSI